MTHKQKQNSKQNLSFVLWEKNVALPWDYDEHYDIFSAQRDGSKLKQLTNSTGYDAEGAYSPDGTKIVFCSLRDAYPLEKLSPEERKQFEKDAAYFGEIYIMNADGSDQKRLTNSPGYDGGPFLVRMEKGSFGGISRITACWLTFIPCG